MMMCVEGGKGATVRGTEWRVVGKGEILIVGISKRTLDLDLGGRKGRSQGRSARCGAGGCSSLFGLIQF